MNFEKLKKNMGYRVQLEPVPIRLDDLGREMPASNDDWIIMAVGDEAIELRGIGFLPFALKLGRDHVHHFTSNPQRSIPNGLQYAFLSLHVQIYLQGSDVKMRPCSRPGERVPPLPVQVKQTWVDFRYPVESGIQARLELQGFRVGWCRRSYVAAREREGWELVIEKDQHGTPMTFHLRDRPEDQIFIKLRTM